jgi:GH15 family glucan-1,4-alpha-glucosidase
LRGRDRPPLAAREIRREICGDSWNDGLGVRQYYGGQQLDASLLLMPLVSFLLANDPRRASTIAVIGRDLTEAGLVQRTARAAEANPEGTFGVLMPDGGLLESAREDRGRGSAV